ncbi:MAG: hypothetical protein P1U49_05100 [Minwuia sp.]|nr:hypothetical protein [Minwuia sp.]
MSPSLNLLVLRAEQPARLAAFYTGIGLEFVTEKHGSGPEHHAAQLGDTIVEIYPCTNDRSQAGAATLGLQVSSLDDLTPFLMLESEVVSAPKIRPWGRTMIVRDPAGHCLHLTEAG